MTCIVTPRREVARLALKIHGLSEDEIVATAQQWARAFYDAAPELGMSRSEAIGYSWIC